MSHQLPRHPNLDHLKQQAKDLLKAYRAGDERARQLVERQLMARYRPRPSGQHSDGRVLLADALLVIAREYGFASWPQLRAHVVLLLAAPRTVAGEPTTPAGESTALAGRQARRVAQEQRLQAMVDRLTAAAQQPDLAQLFPALFAPARDMLAMRAHLVEHGTYTLVIDSLLRGVDHPSAHTRFLTAQAMDHFADARCVEPLRRLLHDPIPRVRWAALHSLACEACKLEPMPAAEDLVSDLVAMALHDPSIKVRRVAAYELGKACPDARAITALETLLAKGTDRAIRRNALAALNFHRQSARR
jgi:HEAT repeat protein